MHFGFYVARRYVAEAGTRRHPSPRRVRAWNVQRELARLRQTNRQLRQHEAQLARQNVQLAEQAQRLAELDQIKSRFFANISHEFRTPLTLLLGPLNDALNGTGDAAGLFRQAALMRRNAHRLLRLIGQLLDLSRLEAGRLRLEAHPTDLDDFLRRVVETFASRAQRQEIALRYEGPAVGQIVACVDRDRLEQVVVNLLSNAFKFTPRGGTVRVALRAASRTASGRQRGVASADEWVELVVEDTGRGIPASALPFVFDRFFQVDASATRAHEGTGIGLALTRELVVLHGGHITVESREGAGTRFTVRLPACRPDATDIVDLSPDSGGDISVAGAWLLEEEAPSSSEPDHEAPGSAEGSEAPTVLVVEDNADLRAYLRRLLREQGYHVEEARDGQEGLELAQARAPELVISDIMMPRLDGVALCRQLKSSPALGHVPVVLLTARAAEEDLLEGLEAGCDDYLSKPFSAEELLVRTENLIEIRRRLRERYSEEVRLGPSQVVVSSQETAFLEQVRAVVEAALSNSHLTMEQVAASVGVSLRQLHRRLKAVAGLTPAGYVRMLRLARAAQLLEQGAGTVSEVAYAVGFNDASYFSRLFKQAHGVPPSQYGQTTLYDTNARLSRPDLAGSTQREQGASSAGDPSSVADISTNGPPR